MFSPNIKISADPDCGGPIVENDTRFLIIENVMQPETNIKCNFFRANNISKKVLYFSKFQKQFFYLKKHLNIKCLESCHLFSRTFESKFYGALFRILIYSEFRLLMDN